MLWEPPPPIRLGEVYHVRTERRPAPQHAAQRPIRRTFEARRPADEPITPEELADEFGVSRERVRQIEVRAFEKVQKAVKTNIAHIENPQAAAAAAMH
jgi:hypothetical protein